MLNAIYFTVHRPESPSRGRFGARALAERRRPLDRLRRILVATDGTAASDGAMLVAGQLARRHGSIVDVVSVLARWAPPTRDDDFPDITGELLDDRLAHVVPQAERALRDAASLWTIRVVDSTSVVDSIAETARSEAHDLIVVGVRRTWFDRWFRSPTALAVARASGVPVLAVPSSVSTLPQVAVVGVDGRAASDSITASVALVLANDAVIHAAAINEGEPVERLTSSARVAGADLIALGVPERGTSVDRITRAAGRRLVRSADSAVLLVPPLAADGLNSRRVSHA